MTKQTERLIDLGELRDETQVLLDTIALYDKAIDSSVSLTVERYLHKACEAQLGTLRNIVADDLW